MTVENHQLDKKSIRALSDISELAKDAVGFANASGGELHIGIEDDADAPPAAQRVEDAQVAQLNKRIGELTVHVSYTAQKVMHENGGEFIRVQVSRNHGAPSSMTDGTYLIRDGDRTRPLRPDELSRFMTDRPSFDWELIATTHSSNAYDAALFARFAERIRASDRVTAFVKAKSNEELLQHYLFVRDGKLTNLGALCVGTREQRAMLNTAPVVQCIKYDDRGAKVRKWVWDDFSLTPWELVDAIWQEIPEWQESYELPDGLFRKHVPVYDEVVVRELLANALVHRPYTQRGDIFINLHPDRLEVHNPGALPIGVTPENILHTSVKRNEHLAKVFYDLKLMEREGSGYDRIYEVLLTSGKALPKVEETSDRVTVTIYRKILDPKIVDFVTKADQAYQLTQKERITLGLLAQKKSFTVMQLAKELKLVQAAELDSWVNRLVQMGLVTSKGRTRGKIYIISRNALKTLEFKGSTTLGAIEEHRLRELILEDLRTYKEAGISEIEERIGKEIPRDRIRGVLKELIQDDKIEQQGSRRWAKYLYKSNDT